MSNRTLTDPTCTTPFPCWDAFGPHQRSFISALTLARAEAIVRGRAKKVAVQPLSEAELYKLRDSIDRLRGLRSAAWRNCVRKPFGFSREAAGQTPQAITTTTTNLSADALGL